MKNKIKVFLGVAVIVLGFGASVALARGMGAPTLSVYGVSNHGVTLSWQSPAGNESGFEVQRGTDGVNFGAIARGYEGKQYNPKTYYFSDGYNVGYGLEHGKKYYYRVLAFKRSKSGNQYSPYSNVVSAQTF